MYHDGCCRTGQDNPMVIARVINSTTTFLYTQNRALGKLEFKKHLKKGVFIQDLKSNAIFAASNVLSPKIVRCPPFYRCRGICVP